jgi:hypothetical protein
MRLFWQMRAEPGLRPPFIQRSSAGKVPGGRGSSHQVLAQSKRWRTLTFRLTIDKEHWT